MNGAETLLHTLVRAGVSTCFGNPGTSEVHFVKGLDSVTDMRCVLALAENVATGAADGYARISEGTAATLLHCGPGLANGMANLHNARKAGSSIVNLVGDQAQFHGYRNPPLASDTENVARSVSAWTRRVNSSLTIGMDAASAVLQSRLGGGAIASLVLPSDVCWGPGGPMGASLAPPPRPRVDDAAIEAAAGALMSGTSTALVLGDAALTDACTRLAAAIARRTGARVFAHSFIRRMARGGGRPAIERIPYAVPAARQAFSGVTQVVLAGAEPPVFAFAGPDGISGPAHPEAVFTTLGDKGHDLEAALRALSERVNAFSHAGAGQPGPVSTLAPARGSVSPAAFGQSLSALLPNDAIVVDEGITFGRSVYDATHHAARHDWLQLTGGAIGSGLPLATGAAIAAPHRRVVTLQADGSGLYTVQALWTQARERLDVTTVVFSNRRYDILFNEMKRMGVSPGASAERLFSLDDPALDWVRIANGFGVEAATARSMEEFNDLFAHSLRRSGPFLIELRCDPAG
ncbi:acetolactate synthase large subunit [Bordetella genomosp. 13]|uniref:acetolactate synthase large subunit n=1 Tax=Bordetella genomosp. 13 TaxID=463040 RepID=UPI0011AA5708|nr:acetolactate synthase large subunit [Bordetella genomosp. 13]